MKTASKNMKISARRMRKEHLLGALVPDEVARKVKAKVLTDDSSIRELVLRGLMMQGVDIPEDTIRDRRRAD